MPAYPMNPDPPLKKPFTPGGVVPKPSYPKVKRICDVQVVPYATGETETQLDVNHESYFEKTVVSDNGLGAIGVDGTHGFINYEDQVIVLPGVVETTTERSKWSNSEGSYIDVQTSQSFVPGSLTVKYAVDGEQQPQQQDIVTVQSLPIQLLPYKQVVIIPGTLRFTFNGKAYSDRSGQGYLYWEDGTLAGTVNYLARIVYLAMWESGSGVLTLTSCITSPGLWSCTEVMFRIAGSPLQVGSTIIQATRTDGELISYTCDSEGYLTGEDIVGTVDQEHGIVVAKFGNLVSDDSLTDEEKAEDWYDVGNVDGDGNIWKPTEVFPSSIKYSSVVYTFLPLEADLIGLDPVRLPSDGKVPVFDQGRVIVIATENSFELISFPVADDTTELGQLLVADVTIRDADGVLVPSTFYGFDRKLGVLTWGDNDWTDNGAGGDEVTPYTLPLSGVFRIEDMALVSEVRIDGTLLTAAPISRAFAAENSTVSSALIFGDMRTRAYNLFTQKSWTNQWSENRIGDDSIAKYDEVNFPIQVWNESTITERCAIVFSSATTFSCYGERRGLLGTGDIYTDFEPINSLTGKSLFRIDYRGWGGGWVSGNTVRFNTEAGNAFWLTRCTEQGDPTHEDDLFCVQARGDSE